MEKQRNSQIELLRILGMILIIFHHLAIHGYLTFGMNCVIGTSASVREINNIIFLKSLIWPGKLGVGLFMMITAWFASSKDGQPNWKKIINIWATYFFYNAILCTILLCNGKLSSILLYLPVLFRTNWYVNGYLLVLLLMPLILEGLEKLSQKNHFYLCIILLVMSFLPWRWEDASYWASSTYTPIDSIEMIIMLIIGNYIKRYNPTFFQKKKLCLGISLVLIAFITLYYFVVFKVGLAKNIDQEILNKQVDYSCCLFPIMSICLFMGLKDINIGSVKIINAISSLTLPVYLFHDNNNFYIPMWSFIRPYMPVIGDSMGKIMLTGVVLCIIFFVIAGIIETIRKFLFKCI